MADPPVAGAVHETVSLSTPAVAVGLPGVFGTVVAVMLAEAEEASDVPYEFVAVTVNVYAVSDCNPVTEIGEEDPVFV
jgi:hypothetical protein